MLKPSYIYRIESSQIDLINYWYGFVLFFIIVGLFSWFVYYSLVISPSKPFKQEEKKEVKQDLNLDLVKVFKDKNKGAALPLDVVTVNTEEGKVVCNTFDFQSTLFEGVFSAAANYTLGYITLPGETTERRCARINSAPQSLWISMSRLTLWRGTIFPTYSYFTTYVPAVNYNISSYTMNVTRVPTPEGHIMMKVYKSDFSRNLIH